MSKQPSVRLGELAHARSGDKGEHANIGVIAYSDIGFDYLKSVLTVQRVADYFQPLGASRVERFELPGIRALNFLLHNVLGGGASRSLRSDAQGKTLALALLEMQLPQPDDLAAMRRVGANGKQP